MPMFGQHVKKGYFWSQNDPFGPKIWIQGFFGKNPTVSLFYPYQPLTSCKKSGKSLEPFSSNMEITLLLGPFWAKRPLKYHISAHFKNTRFFPEKRPCTFLALIVVNFHAKYKENPWSRFEKFCGLTNQPTNQQTTGVILWDLSATRRSKIRRN